MTTKPLAPVPARPQAANPDEATAYLLSLAMGDPALTPTKALEVQMQRVAALRDPTAPASLDELARQLPLLEALFLRFSAEALRAKSPDSRSKLLRAALSAQQAHARTFALLRALAPTPAPLITDADADNDSRRPTAPAN